MAAHRLVDVDPVDGGDRASSLLSSSVFARACAASSSRNTASTTYRTGNVGVNTVDNLHAQS